MSWEAVISYGDPEFTREGDVLSIITEENERGIWRTEFIRDPEIDEIILGGSWVGGKLRIRTFNDSGEVVGEMLYETPPEDGVLVLSEDIVVIQLNCICNENSVAVFTDIDLIYYEEVDPGLPIPENYKETEYFISGFDFGSIMSLWRHGEAGEVLPLPMYEDEYGEIIPYKITGTQRGRVITLTVDGPYVSNDGDDMDPVNEEGNSSE